MKSVSIRACGNVDCFGHVMFDETGRNVSSFWKIEDAEEIQAKVNGYGELKAEVAHLSGAVDDLSEHCQDYELQLSSMAIKKDALLAFVSKLATMSPADNLDVKAEAVNVLEGLK